VKAEPEIQLLKEVLKHYSPTGSTTDLGNYLASWCKEHGLDAEVLNGMVVINPEAKDLLLLGHMDTVTGKLSVELNSDKNVITGRGAADAKGPLCAAVAAVFRHPELCNQVCLVAVPDEEGASEAAAFIRDNWPPRPCIILEPSSWQGITLSYMGRIHVKCTAQAPPSHPGHKEPFATEKLYSIWNSISKSHITRIRSITGNETEASMLLDIRFRDATYEEILSIFPNDIEVEVIEKTLPYTANKNTKLTRSFLRAIRESDGTPVFKKKTGTSDMNVLGEKWDTAMVAYGPGDGKLGHTNSEQISIDEYLNGIEVLEKVLLHIVKA
jgi:LysW-gamma-L-lysine carboxypeptidase